MTDAMHGCVGAIVGGLVGVAGAWLTEHLQFAAKGYRNGVYFARGEPGVKDMVFRTPWRALGAVGVVAGAIVGLASGRWWGSALAGGALPLVRTVAAVYIATRAYRDRWKSNR